MRKILILAAAFILSANSADNTTTVDNNAAPAPIDGWTSCNMEIVTASFGTKIPMKDIPIAQTTYQINQGVSNLNSGMPIMLFLWQNPRRYAFSMRMVQRPMTVAFINDKGEIAQIENMKPNSDKQYVSDKPVHAVLEVGKGFLSSHNITIGSKIVIKQCSAPTAFPDQFFKSKDW
ncbi:MAG: DUF192 domain-containing protein [Zymomonas mobilis subsp. pomaceae]|uniref:DUF192 domain-containing protein n=1 Tax=Zymomonas mobilis subsp. pomaceae (strain ATCC 29192 / DSM 22645 / JCM 10191 / CCUG 17912 / NBRC 13757 / NCIMB 11200 / NRRL B-4491 / Barker I) TaxID=579138 RepID=F8EUZ7_ZYMMT|nr:DUF192 domain-containing protein [Zymomonas mobilis]AEI37285.1 protein of unknown function DUF192 [Zymomonas mobilis subsp. pomaceae ATCC 29192]MDX5948654.1 DUF192 domain-containing protein [Zymomonas mobilis subsp. pomaceae]GEB88459.1 hypothetical protein ZMO02_00960 [Zymomonas mobilis subsp. pomaceae]